MLFFECNEEVMEERLIKRGQTSGRVDDNAETIKKRFATFMEKTLPVVQSYEEKNKVKRVSKFGASSVIMTNAYLVSNILLFS